MPGQDSAPLSVMVVIAISAALVVVAIIFGAVIIAHAITTVAP